MKRLWLVLSGFGWLNKNTKKDCLWLLAENIISFVKTVESSAAKLVAGNSYGNETTNLTRQVNLLDNLMAQTAANLLNCKQCELENVDLKVTTGGIGSTTLVTVDYQHGNTKEVLYAYRNTANISFMKSFFFSETSLLMLCFLFSLF